MVCFVSVICLLVGNVFVFYNCYICLIEAYVIR